MLCALLPAHIQSDAMTATGVSRPVWNIFFWSPFTFELVPASYPREAEGSERTRAPYTRTTIAIGSASEG